MIRLFEKTATIWTSQGLGEIGATRCLVTEERNGMYECEMDVPITDKHYVDIALGCLILVKPNPYEIAQPFRIYQISRPLNGLVTVNAAHLSYDLSKIADQPFTASSVTETMVRLANNAVGSCPFTFQTDKSVTGTFTVSTPRSIRSLLAGSQGSVLDVYGTGEWKFDGYTCYLYLNRGQDRGVVIRYGKNLTDLKQEENNASVYSKLYPYWTDSEGHLVTLTEKTLDINTAGNGTLVYDMSNSFEAQPTEQQLRTAAQSYIDRNSLGTPTVNLSLSFVQISELIKDAIYLCDTVSVEFPALNVSAQAKVIKTVYDALLDRYDSIEVGTVKQTLAQTITELQDNSVTGSVGKSVMQSAIDSSTAQITGNKGGYIVWHDSNQDGQPDELLVMDTPSIETAVKVWRFNKNGLGFSATGYDGEYALAMTADGAIVADMITVGTLSATLMRAGILKSLNYDSSGGTAGFSMNMETGEIFAPALVISAKNYTDTEVTNALATAAADATSKANAAQAAAKSYTDTQISVIPGQISSAISEIQVGGTNLLHYTADYPLSGGLRWYASGTGASVSISSATDFPISGLNHIIRVTNTGSSTSAQIGIAHYTVPGLILNEVYSEGCWVRASVAGLTLRLQPAWNSTTGQAVSGAYNVGTTTTSWQYIKVEGIKITNFSATDVVNAGYVYMVQAPAGSWLEVCGSKLELGNKATDWSPNPEDYKKYVENNYSTITQTASQISTAVASAKTYTDNAVDDYNSKFNTVEQNLTTLTQTTAGISTEVSKKVNVTTYNANNQAVSQQISNLSSRIDQTAGSIRGIVSEEISGLEDQAESISNWFDFSVSNFLTIGQAGSAYKTQITNSAFNILHGSSVIGSFSSSGLDTSAITLDTSLSLPPFTLESINNGTEWLLTE